MVASSAASVHPVLYTKPMFHVTNLSRSIRRSRPNSLRLVFVPTQCTSDEQRTLSCTSTGTKSELQEYIYPANRTA